jgi:hypothetical protein
VNQILVHVLLEYRERRKEREVADAHRPVEGVEEPDPAISVVVGVGEGEAVTFGGSLEAVKEQRRSSVVLPAAGSAALVIGLGHQTVGKWRR